MVDVDQEPVAIRVTRYRCPFCRKSSSRKPGIRVHIEQCWHNPTARACGTCRHADLDPCEEDVGCAVDLDPYVKETVEVANPDDVWTEDVPGPRRVETRFHLVRQCPGWEAA